MKERAIDIFEKRKEKKKGRGVERTLTGATGGSRLSGFNLRQHAYHISNEKQKKGYQSLVSSFSVYNRRNARIQVSDVMIQTLSCHVI